MQAAAYANLVGVTSAGTGAGTSGVTCMMAALPRVWAGNAAGSLLFSKVNSKLTADAPALRLADADAPRRAPRRRRRRST